MKISVCIPTYNQAAYVEQSIRSVYAQTVQPYEVIVSNDLSSDDTQKILNELSKEFKNLKIINQPINLGMVANTNKCLRIATGEYIIKLDSDDYLLPDYIKVLSELLNQYPEAGYAHGAVQEIDFSGDKVAVRRLFRKNGFVDGNTALRACVKGYKVAANIIMFRKEALDSVNYITSNVSFAEDYYLSAEMAVLGYGNVYSEKVLSCYRVWADSGNIRQKRKLDEINGLKIILDEIIRPAFSQRGWNLKIVDRAKGKFAKKQLSCMGWKIYSSEEKKELEKAILQLSDGYETHFLIWVYKNGFGETLDSFQRKSGWLKQKSKKVFLYLK